MSRITSFLYRGEAQTKNFKRIAIQLQVATDCSQNLRSFVE